MSRENVEFVARTIEVFNRRDVPALEERSDQDLQIVSVLIAANLGGDAYKGIGAWRDYFAAMDEAWNEFHLEDVRLLEGAEGWVVCLCRLVGKGKQSGVRVERPTGILFKTRGGRMWRIRSYLDPNEALEAAGLSE